MERSDSLVKEVQDNKDKSRNPLLLKNTLDLSEYGKSTGEKRGTQALPEISHQISNDLSIQKFLVKNKSTHRAPEVYQPYLKERDSMGRLIGFEPAKTTKTSPRHLLPTVYQFNK